MQTLGARASAAWLEDLGLDTGRVPRWYVEVALAAVDEDDDLRFELNVYPEEWGYVLRAGTRVSAIRISDAPFIHGRDDHQLLPLTPGLSRIGDLIAVIETRRIVAFRRSQAMVRSNLVRATSVVRTWLNTI